MFERYTEKARRAIFFARYEASQLGSPVITTEHLLLGLLRESRNLQTMLRVDMAELSERLRSPVTAAKVSTSADIPLDNGCKRAVAHAAEEADRLNHRHIGNEHLLLGIMREERGRAAQVLREMGAAAVDEVRKAVHESEPEESQAVRPGRRAPQFPTVKLVDEETGREFPAG